MLTPAPAPQSKPQNCEVRRSVRTAPTRPKLSSSLGSESEGQDLPADAQDSEGVASSDTESGVLTVEQLLAEVSNSYSRI
jgi:hypothetical protein